MMDSDDLQQYLQPTEFIDSTHPSVIEFAETAMGEASTDRERAIKLFYAVRDDIRYNPYVFGGGRSHFNASYVVSAKETFCVPKANLLAACARHAGIPARVGFADVRNHLCTPRLLDTLGSDIFIFHGFTELYIEGKWVRVTATFNKSLCEKFKVKPLEFDGVNESLFHEFDQLGRKHMEYLHYHGVFADLPFNLMMEKVIEGYPKMFKNLQAKPKPVSGDFEQEAAEATEAKAEKHAA